MGGALYPLIERMAIGVGFPTCQKRILCGCSTNWQKWDLGGFPAWLLAIEPALKLRSADPVYLKLVERWWGILLPRLVPFLYVNGGPIVMVQIENEYGSFGNDKAYLHRLANLARFHLGNDTILYTTDGGTKDTLDKGAIPEEGVYAELRNVIAKYSKSPLPPVPSGNGRAEYRMVKVNKIGSLFDALDLMCLPTEVVETKEPVPMELVGQMFGFLLYESEFSEKESKRTLSIPKVHDRAQVFVSCSSKDDQGRPVYVGTIQRGSNCELEIPNIKCSLKIRLFILVENMGHVNYGPYIYDRKGILSSVALDGNNIHGWKIYPISLEKFCPLKEKVRLLAGFNANKIASRKHSKNVSEEPRFYEAHYCIDPNDQIKDVFISFQGWNKGVAFVNNFNIGRFWPSLGPQCTLYVPAPILHHGKNVVVIFELHAPNPELTIEFVQQPNFTCGHFQRQV
ncbi:hypothetical protein HPP92_005527 [Vanilla planifolia]|uniref:beta-galactosidase n=1 Tax=Vanilla planifolia TaxID=51239 RepID=A0A835V956_VANPL|nr:hypothetical protein HPP92_005527 [Vanilla planifolia]